MTKDEDISLLNQMRQARGTYEAVYIKFVNSRKYYNSYAFCFYEGEDGKYYNPRIRKFFSDKFLTYPVGNKKEVLKLLRKINSENLYTDVCMMFFVDRDYDESLEGADENLYETPCYSIENLYVKKECLKQILQSEFGLNVIDEDYKKCMRDFCLREVEFHEIMLEFNALAYLRRKRSDSNSNCSFGSIKTSHIANIEVGKVDKSEKYEETIEGIKNILQFQESEIQDAKNVLTKKGDYSTNFRGKNQLDFFVVFINKLKNLNRTGGYFSGQYNSIHINISSNRLSELSQYAITPLTLSEFIEGHWSKLSKLIKSAY